MKTTNLKAARDTILVMNMPLVIAFVGMPGSGKGTCTTYLSENYHWPIIHFGNMVYEEVQRRGLDNVKDEKFVREDIRHRDGLAVLAKHAAKKAKGYIADGKSRVILDGLYSWSEYKYLAETFGDQLITIAIIAPRAERWRRVTERKDSHRKYTLEQIKVREFEEIEHLEKGGPIAYADYSILNDQNPQNLTDQLDSLLKKLVTRL